MAAQPPEPGRTCREECPREFRAADVAVHFPILRRLVHGRPLVYLDNAATTQKPRQVIQALVDFYEQHNANVHRGVHALGEEATALYEGARARVARFLGGLKAGQVVFTRNTTESLNLLAQGLARRRLRPGEAILLTEMEHHSNLVPWQLVAQETGAALRFIPVTPEGRLDLDALPGLLDGRLRFFSVIHASNVLGTINPVAELIARVRQASPRVVTIVDATQTVPQMPVDFSALGADALVFSSHKTYGPTGIGVLAAREELLDEMPPFLGGGEMIERVGLESSTFAGPPARFEAGTPNFADAAGLAAALDFLDGLGRERIRDHSACITEYALDRLGEIPSLRIFGPRRADDRVGLVAFEDRDIHPHDLATVLDREGIAVRAGHHCAQPLARKLGVASTTRASFAVYNTRSEVDRLAEALIRAREFFGHAA